MRRYDIPDQTPVPNLAQLRGDRDHAAMLQSQADLTGLLRVLPGLLSQTTTYAHAAASPKGWALLADVYSFVYHLSARYRWTDLLEMAPARQAWAAEQTSQPMLSAAATVQRAGAFLNLRDFEGGLTVVDRAIVTAETALSGTDKAFTIGALDLRGMTLAGRLGERTEAQRHINAAWTAASSSRPTW